jgi:hypothetical protein
MCRSIHPSHGTMILKLIIGYFLCHVNGTVTVLGKLPYVCDEHIMYAWCILEFKSLFSYNNKTSLNSNINNLSFQIQTFRFPHSKLHILINPLQISPNKCLLTTLIFCFYLYTSHLLSFLILH